MDFQGGLIFEGTSGVFHRRSGDIFLAIFFFFVHIAWECGGVVCLYLCRLVNLSLGGFFFSHLSFFLAVLGV
jgi:hypothetical protein